MRARPGRQNERNHRKGAAVAGAALVAGVAGCTAIAGLDALVVVPDLCVGCGDAASGPDAREGGALDGPGGADADGASGDGPPKSCLETGDPDLVAYYPLDETAGTTARDCSGHGHDGVVLSAPSGGGWTAGKFGGGFTADTSSGCINLGTPAELVFGGASFTVAAWAKVRSYGTGVPAAPTRYLVGHTRDTQVAGWRLGTDPGSVFSFRYHDTTGGTPITQTANGQPTGQWFHVTARFSATEIRIFLDGVPVGTPGATGAITPPVAATVRIGCRGADDAYLDGTIDEVRLYKRALSDADIAALAAKTK